MKLGEDYEPGEDYELEEYYAICSSVEEDVFKDIRIITIGTNKQLLVDKSCLKVSLDGFIVALVALEKIENGLAHGYVWNCQNGFPSGKISIPIDSLTDPKKVKDYNGETYKK